MIVRVEHIEDRWDHDYQPRLQGRFPDGCVICGEPHDEFILHLGGRS